MLKQLQVSIRLTTLALLAGLSGVLLAAFQTGGVQLQLSPPDTSNFPDLTLHLVALDEQGNVITDLTALELQEDGTPIAEFALEPIDVGTELIIVIDANSTIENRDEVDGATRREKVRDSIVRYANHHMDPTQLDTVTIIVPAGDSSRVLDRAGMTFPNEVINAINFYETGELGETALNQMLTAALDQAESNREQGRHQALLLYSDAANLDNQLDYPGLVARAQELGVPIYGAILGGQASAEEMASIGRLADPTGGGQIHLADPLDASPLFESIQQRGTQTKVSYRSGLDSSGRHSLTAELGSGRAQVDFELIVAPPIAVIAVDNSRPIRRVAADAQTPLEQMEPKVQPLVAEVDWPDGQPRSLASVALLVNGSEVPLDSSILDDSGLLTFDWDIRQLDQGTYVLQIMVTDELGLQGVSEPLPLTLEVQRPVIAATATSPPPAPPTEAASQPAEQPAGLPANTAIIGGGLLAFFLVLALLIVAVALVSRNRRAAQPIQAASGGQSAPEVGQAVPAPGKFDDNVTYVVPPDFAVDEATGAYLEPLENAPEHTGLIPVVGSNVAFGRDVNRVEVPFKDRSVSRLHARIMESRGAYRIYDEGSSSGTYVNYKRIGLAPQSLSDRDDIHFGRVHLRFHLASTLRQGDSTQKDKAGNPQEQIQDTDSYQKPY